MNFRITQFNKDGLPLTTEGVKYLKDKMASILANFVMETELCEDKIINNLAKVSQNANIILCPQPLKMTSSSQFRICV